MYLISDYIIEQPINSNERLLYSTLSTSLVTLENSMYDVIFEQRDFYKYPEECAELEKMGFLFQGKPTAQLDELYTNRKEIVDAAHGITSVTIAPTMECNARCYYCFENGAEKGSMSEKTADAVVRFIVSGCVEKKVYISWFGGEPLLAPEIINQITEGLHENGIEVESSITTNGLLINDDIIESFPKWGVTRVQITLDGIGAEYNRVKNYRSTTGDPFEQIIINIDKVISSNIHCHLRVNYKSDSHENVKKTMDYLHNRFGDNKNVFIYGAPLDLPRIKGYSEFDAEEGDIFLRVLDDSFAKGYEKDEIDFRELRVSDDYHPALGKLMIAPFPANCYMVNKSRFVIDDKGYLYKCQKHLGVQRFNCGSVFEGVIENDIFSYYSTARLHDEKCAKCRMLPICQGGCNANRLLHGDRFACPPSKSIIEKLVFRYYQYIQNGNS